MASTKFDVASSALIMVGANPVSSFLDTEAASAEQRICYHLYQSCLDQWLSLYPWRFATKVLQLSRDVAPPDPTKWSASYTQPTGMRALQNVQNIQGDPFEYDRFEGKILLNVDAATAVYGEYSFEPSVSTWPGYFTAIMELALAAKFAFPVAGKLDLKKELEDSLNTAFRLGKNADARQQTAKKLPLRTGRGTLLEARRA